MRRPATKPHALALLLFALARTANAASPDSQTAEALFQSGKEAMDRGDLAAACPRFAESVRLDPAVGSFLNLAECEERAGNLASALAHFQTARDRLPATDYRVPFVTARIAKLGPRVPRLTLILTPATDGATVVRDQTPLGQGSLGVELPVDPGVHVLVVHAPGHADVRREVTLREGESRTFPLTPGAVVDAPPMSPQPETSQQETSTTGRTQRAIGVTLGGAGLALIAAGSVVAIVSKSTYDSARSHCPAGPASCTADGVSGGQTAYTEASAATIGFIVGGAFAAAGLTLYLTAPHGLHVTTTAAAHEGGLRLEGTW